MFYQRSAALLPTRVSRFQTRIIIALLLVALAPCGSADHIFAQGFEKELDAPEKVEVRVKNLRGRVTVIASEELNRKISIRAESPKALITDEDVRAEVAEGRVEITTATVRGGSRDESYGNGAQRGGAADDERIDLVIRVPPRARVKIETGDGAADVVGNVASAEVTTATGTIRADVPLDALKYSFQWTASRPRFFSEVELPEVKERRGGVYEIAGRFGDKDAKETERIKLDLVTSRGVVLFGVSTPRLSHQICARARSPRAHARSSAAATKT